MKKAVAAACALSFYTASALAADLGAKPVYKAPPAPASSWTGFYLSAGGGYGLWEADQKTTDVGIAALLEERTAGRGYFGTVSGGYDWQFAPVWVAGVFADVQFGDLKGGYDTGWHGADATTKNTLNYAAGVRLGYLVAPNVLSYVNGGYSHADFDGGNLVSAQTGTPLPGRSFGKMHLDGWFVGGGFENSLNLFGVSSPGWFMKTEYRLAQYDGQSTLFPGFGGANAIVSFKPYVQTVSTSIVYRFNSSVASSAYASAAPLVAKAPVAAPHSWTGFYLAGGGGYGLLAADGGGVAAFGGPVASPVRVGGRGYFGTVSGGYDWQFAPTWVGGVFGDAQFGDIKGSIAIQSVSDVGTITNNVSYAAGVRLGYLVAPNVLSYLNGGYSHADFSKIDVVQWTGPTAFYTVPKSKYDGWFVGGGVENSLNLFGVSAPGWFMKTEYRLAQYGRKDIGILSGGAPSGNTLSLKPYVQTVSTSLVYRF